MARTELTPDEIAGPYSQSGTDLTWTAGDATNGNQFAATGREIVLARNTDTATHTVTIVSVNDPYGRSADASEQLATSGSSGDHTAFGPVPRIGWQQSDGKVYIDVTDATIELAVLRLSTG
jgi:hypothetical protein